MITSGTYAASVSSRPSASWIVSMSCPCCMKYRAIGSEKWRSLQSNSIFSIASNIVVKVVCAWQYIKRKIYQDSRRIVKTKTFEIIRSGKIRVRQKRFRIFLEKVERAAYKKLDMFREIEKRRADVSQYSVEMLNINKTTENPPPMM